MRKYDNFCSAFANLKEIYNYSPPYDTVTLTGLVALYEICFEQSWEMMKEVLSTMDTRNLLPDPQRQYLRRHTAQE